MDSKDIRRILIIDAITGITLYERLCNWEEKGNSTSLSSLIQSFYQLSREIDDGDIRSVSFENRSSVSKPLRRYQIPSPAGKVPSWGEGAAETMKMVSSKGDDVIISIFCTSSEQNENFPDQSAVDKLNTIALNLKNAFLEHCGELVTEVRPRLHQSMCEKDEGSKELQSIRALFHDVFACIEVKIIAGQGSAATAAATCSSSDVLHTIS